MWKKYKIESLPIKINNNYQLIIEKLIDEILSNVSNDNPVDNLMEKLNLIVYKLYNLDLKDILVIDPTFSLTQEEYDNYKIES